MKTQRSALQVMEVRTARLLSIAVLCAWLLTACRGTPAEKPHQLPTKKTVSVSAPSPMPQPSLALSLTVLQAQAEQHGGTLPQQLVQLGGLNRIHGFLLEPDGEVILLGEHDPALPTLHLDDVAVALRNAYQVSAAYQGVLGCTIDPWAGAEDPWRIQRVTVFGMPPTVRMAARHVLVDFELKKVSAGLLLLVQGVPSLHELDMATFSPCAG